MKYVPLKSSEKRRTIAKSRVLDFASHLLKVNSIVPGKAREQAGAQFTCSRNAEWGDNGHF